MNDLLLLAQTSEPDAAFLIWGSALFALAIVLIVMELFIPSGGILAALSGIVLVAAIISFFRYDTMVGLGAIGVTAVLIPAGIVFVFKVWMHTSFGRRLILGGNDDDAQAARREAEESRRKRLEALHALIGTEGRTETSLRPVGTVRIAGRRIDAMAESGIIEANRAIIVTAIYDNQIKVREVDASR